MYSIVKRIFITCNWKYQINLMKFILYWTCAIKYLNIKTAFEFNLKNGTTDLNFLSATSPVKTKE